MSFPFSLEKFKNAARISYYADSGCTLCCKDCTLLDWVFAYGMGFSSGDVTC